MFDQVVTLTGGGPGTSTETLAYFIFNVRLRVVRHGLCLGAGVDPDRDHDDDLDSGTSGCCSSERKMADGMKRILLWWAERALLVLVSVIVLFPIAWMVPDRVQEPAGRLFALAELHADAETTSSPSSRTRGTFSTWC